MPLMVPVVKKDQAEAFGKVWNHNGIAIMLTDVHYQFATDFANVALRSFIADCQQRVAQQAAPAPLQGGENAVPASNIQLTD